MTKNIIGFFCGTEYTCKNDKLYEYLHDNVNVSNTTLLAYDGCLFHGGGLFAFGVEHQADAFITELKNNIESLDETENIHINFVAHSQGCLSALLAIKKIQADPQLKARIEVTVDLHEPVPRNFRWSATIGGNLMIANMVHDVSHCDVVKKAYVTLQEKGLGYIGWDSLIPKFHAATQVEVEALPGWYDVQHNDLVRADIEHAALFQLGQAKTLAILRADGNEVGANQDVLIQRQIGAYGELIVWAKNRVIPFGERALHFGGQLIANNQKQNNLEVINWRHAQLIGAVPEHVLYGVSHPYYNYKKSNLEHYCNLTLTLDEFLVRHPEHQTLVQQLRDSAQRCAAERYTGLDKLHMEFQEYLNQAMVHDKSLYMAINSMCMNGYFLELGSALEEIPKANELSDNVLSLKSALEEELDVEICTGKGIMLIRESHVLKVAKNTIDFLHEIYATNTTPDIIINAAVDYMKANIRWGRHWSTGSKVISSLLLSVAAAAVGCMIGAIVGFSFGVATGAIIGPGALITAIVGAFMGSFQGAMIAATSAGAAVGLTVGGAGAHAFFALSAAEKQVQALANRVIGEERSVSNQ